jgi:hypothetical protein
MPNEDDVRQVEMRQQFCQIVGIMIHIVAIPRLTGAAMSAPIVRDAAETTLRKEKHLVFESVRAERPTMTKYDGPTGAPILVVNLGAISGGESAHVRSYTQGRGRNVGDLAKDCTRTAIPALRRPYHFLKMGFIRAARGTPATSRLGC